MFEPLAKLFDKHATKAVTVLEGVLKKLDHIIINTTGAMEFEQFGTYGETGKFAPLELTNNEGCYWEITSIGISGEAAKNVAIHIGTSGPESIVAVVPLVEIGEGGGFAGSVNRNIIVPPRATLYVVGKGSGSINAQVKRLIENPEYERLKARSFDISDIDKRLSEPERHRPPRTITDDRREIGGVPY